MTSRERYVNALTFGRPDRVPFMPGWPRQSTLAAWRRQGLPERADWFAFLLRELGVEGAATPPPIDLGVDFRMIPQFEEKVLEHRNGHYVVQDWKGNVCEISDQFDVTYLRTAKDFVTRRWIRCPVNTRDDWEQMKARYEMDSPGRFAADFSDRCRRAADRDGLLRIAFPGPFWQMREWCGFEGLCMMMIDEPDLVAEMAEFWKEFVAAMLERALAHVAPDAVVISEDMAYKAKAMISPAMTREFCVPSWRRWRRQLSDAGTPVIEIDSDGYVGELVPLWIECGVNVCSPMEVAAGSAVDEFRRRFRRRMGYSGGVDKRCIARGGQAIRDEIRRIEPVVADGGYIPGCDHGVPPDVSWPNFVDYGRLLAKITGWL